MEKIFVIICVISMCLAAPRYGDDGGYQGFASYKPLSALGELLRISKSTPIEDVSHSEDYPSKNSAPEKLTEPPRVSKVLNYPSDSYSVPKNYDVLNDVPKYYSANYGGDNLLEISASPYEHSARYGTRDGGYKIADVYSNDYSGNSYAEHDEYENHHPQPYEYGYQIKDKYGNEQFKAETSDSEGRVKGVYGYTDENGIFRKVEYIADKDGFRANIKTNEPGTHSQDPADVHVDSSEKLH